MRVRVIQKPQYMALCHVQVKHKWWPFWWTVARNDRLQCERIAENLLKTGRPETIYFQGEA
jgi:hypothetical protein